MPYVLSAQISYRHSQPIKQLMQSEGEAIFFEDFSNQIYRLNQSHMADIARWGEERCHIIPCQDGLHWMRCNDQVGPVVDDQLVSKLNLNATDSIIVKRVFGLLIKTEEALQLYNIEGAMICSSKRWASAEAKDILLWKGSDYLLTTDKLVALCGNARLALPFDANCVIDFQDDNLLFATDDGLWTYFQGDFKRYYIPGIEFPKSVIRLLRLKDHIFILDAQGLLWVYDTKRQILERWRSGISDIVVDNWHKFYFIENDRIESSERFVNMRPPKLSLESVLHNSKPISDAHIAYQMGDQCEIDLDLSYSPQNEKVLFQYLLDDNLGWKETKLPIQLSLNKQYERISVRAHVVNKDIYSEILQIDLDYQEALHHTFWPYLFLVFGILIMVLAFSLWRLRIESKKNQASRLTLERELALLKEQQRVRQLQMNPHFIFNVMNSISGMIALGQNADAKKALQKLSTMMRAMLNFGDFDRIKLSEEMAFIHNYMQLEQIINQGNFEFEVLCNSTAEDIPPMLIQPLVENAIIHGIRYKDGEGKILVKVSDENPYIKVEVVDNGMGINAKDMQKMHSKATKLIKSRLMHMDKWKLKTHLTYKNIADVSQAKTGTHCTLYIPR